MPSVNNQIVEILPHLQRYGRFLARNPEQADDLVQDCVERAMRKADFFQDGTNLRAWMFTMMRNIFVNGKRRQAVAARHAEGVKSHAQSCCEPAQFHSVLLSRVQSAMEALSHEEREVVMKLGVEQWPYRDLVAETGSPAGTMKSRLSRARGKLRKAVLTVERPLVPESPIAFIGEPSV